MNRYFDKDGSPMTLMQWAQKFEDNDYKRVALDEGRHYRVSTVWLGLNHAYGEGEPLIFETMVFPVDSMDELDMDRYSTLAEAEAGHAAMVEKWRAKAVEVQP